MNVEGRKEALIKSTLDLIALCHQVLGAIFYAQSIKTTPVDFLQSLSESTPEGKEKLNKFHTINSFIESLVALVFNGIPYDRAVNLAWKGERLVKLIPDHLKDEFLQNLTSMSQYARLLQVHTGNSRCVG